MNTVEIKGKVTSFMMGCAPDGQDYARLGDVETTVEVRKGEDKQITLVINHDLKHADNGVIEFHMAYRQSFPVLGQDNYIACTFGPEFADTSGSQILGDLKVHTKIISAGEGDFHHTFVLESVETGPKHHIGLHCKGESLDWVVGQSVCVTVALLEAGSQTLPPDPIPAFEAPPSVLLASAEAPMQVGTLTQVSKIEQ